MPRLSTVASSPGSSHPAALPTTVSRSQAIFLPCPKRVCERSAGVIESSTAVKVLRLTSEQLGSLRTAAHSAACSAACNAGVRRGHGGAPVQVSQGRGALTVTQPTFAAMTPKKKARRADTRRASERSRTAQRVLRRVVGYAPYGAMRRVTRRFCSRPAAVSFGAMCSVSP